jgi:hypothetical protein
MFQLSVFYVMTSLSPTSLTDEGLWSKIISLYRILANKLAVGEFGETFEGLRMAEQCHILKSLFSFILARNIMSLSLSAPEENSLNELVSRCLKHLLNHLPLKRTSDRTYLPLDTFCLKVKTEYEKLSEKAIKKLYHFPTYLCEYDFYNLILFISGPSH